jgi:perosamine synthetase
MKKISILEPGLFQNEKKYLNLCFKNNEISTYGRYIEKFESRIRFISASKYCVATTSGSTGLFLALKAIKVKKEDLIIAPSYTFAATVNSIIHNSARPLLFDICSENMCIDLNKVSEYLKNKTYLNNDGYYYDKITKKRIYCMMPVTTFSIIPNMQKIKEIGKKYNLKIITDAASALGSKYNNKSISNYSDLVVYSFNGNKSYTSGGGGAVVTNKKNYSNYVKLLSTNAKSTNKPYSYAEPGFNYKITNLHAAIGLGQLENFKKINNKKKKMQYIYKKHINNKKNIKFPPEPKYSNHILWINFLITNNLKLFNSIKKKLIKVNYNLINFWKPIHLQKKFPYLQGSNFSYTNQIWKKLIVLPSSINLKIKQQKKIIKEINSCEI